MSNPPPSRRLNDEMHTNPSSPWKAVKALETGKAIGPLHARAVKS